MRTDAARENYQHSGNLARANEGQRSGQRREKSEKRFIIRLVSIRKSIKRNKPNGLYKSCITARSKNLRQLFLKTADLKNPILMNLER